MKREREKLREQLLALEQELAKTRSLDGSQDDGGPYQFVSNVISAISLIRREELDADKGHPYGYRTAMLEEMHPEMLAQFTAALAMCQHRDEHYAAALLKQQGEDVLLSRAYAVVARFGKRTA